MLTVVVQACRVGRLRPGCTLTYVFESGVPNLVIVISRLPN
jgi:hypothetical protein